ncbi:hypothetical protein KM043_016654 [Ampulex compressa]|nr:hypothetical protein KM043_016654 [Ampulex compressa]
MSADDEAVMVDNLKRDVALVSRIENLREVLRKLRAALREERLNLQEEIEMTILQKFIEFRSSPGSLRDQPSWSPLVARNARIPGNPFEFHRAALWNGNGNVRPPKFSPKLSRNSSGWKETPATLEALLDDGNVDQDTRYLACFESSIYQSTLDELRGELRTLEKRFLTPMPDFHKRKIHDLEASCRAELREVRSRLVRSLQGLASIEASSARGSRPGARRAIRQNANASSHRRPISRNAKCSRPFRSKSVVIGNVQGLWWTRVCSQRYSDSEMCNKTHEARRFLPKSQQIVTVVDSVDDLRISRSFVLPCDVESLRGTLL